MQYCFNLHHNYRGVNSVLNKNGHKNFFQEYI